MKEGKLECIDQFEDAFILTIFPEEVALAKASLASMSIDALLKLRDDIGTALNRKASGLRDQLSRLGQDIAAKGTGERSSLRGRKVPIKYRDKSGNAWSGRGAQPVWLREKLKAGAKIEDFAVNKSVTPRKKSIRKRRKARRKR
jgi:DNA-binding protein H-NS